MARARRIWLLFAIMSIGMLGGDLAYLNWRERSLEPLSAPIDLARPGTYTFDVSGFHSSSYHPEFRLLLPFETDIHNWFPDDGYRQLWADSPPEVRIAVFDEDERRVLQEESTLTRSNGWIVTGALRQSEVEVYKFAEFTGRMFGAYRVSLTVVRGSPLAASYRPHFEIAAIKAYALLPSILSFMTLVATVLMVAVVIGIAHFRSHRRRRAPRPSGTAA